MTVVIFAQEADAPVDAVVRELTRRDAPVFRADTSWFPNRLVLDAELIGGTWSGWLRTSHRSVALQEIRSIWYRDPSAFQFPNELTDVERAYAHREARLGFGGVLAALDGVRWVNHPNRAADAVYKPLQLAIAAASGLSVLPTLVTNSPEAVHRFAGGRPEQVSCKSFGPNTITEGGDLKVAFNRPLTDGDLADLSGVASTATQLQDYVCDKVYEARVVVIGWEMFAITMHTDAPRADIRQDFSTCRYQWIPTPPHVARGLHRYMDRLGLAYAAFDFVIDTSHHWWFLESNSAGQYRWLEVPTEAPMTATFADLLATGRNR
ncbi:ATP-grasp ribosomal peptide maturase [Herbihabitans rhizosphaerae]|uniref:ATP-grasp ribosomal peptide maturase n=1 Tax=Herbihabitans rhizosphaerae TaxID=1872711 RepID=A0A4Q7KW67_9PSEU|nr:ATP-grasp ribosomal peptide maturase [Herbihabitans rhizosphaerae]RZS40887.1 ATP-grasp ribosomal peptide maturase [Herbihabitans rhizosphaerae]